MTHFRISLSRQQSNAGQTLSTFVICSNKCYGSGNGAVSLPSGRGQWKGLLSRVDWRSGVTCALEDDICRLLMVTVRFAGSSYS